MYWVIPSRLFHKHFSQLAAADRGLTLHANLSVKGLTVYVHIFLLIKCLIHTKNVYVVNSKTICKLTASSATIRHDDCHSVDSEGFLKMPS